MMRNLAKLVVGTLTLTWLAGCGASALTTEQGATASTVEAQRHRGPRFGAPSDVFQVPHGNVPTDFTTIQAVVVKLLPPDNSGLPHEKFVVQETQPQAGQILEVDHDTAMAPPVPVQPGEALTIRGVLYSDANKQGIHWTHHASQPGDAGFIQTPDGHVFQ